MGGMAGVGVAPPPNHPPTSLAGGSTRARHPGPSIARARCGGKRYPGCLSVPLPPKSPDPPPPDNPLQTAPFLIARYDDARAKPTHARALRRRRRSLARSRARCVAVTVEVAGGYIARHARYARRASRACTRTSSPRIARVIAVSVPPVHDRHARAAAAAALARSCARRRRRWGWGWRSVTPRVTRVTLARVYVITAHRARHHRSSSPTRPHARAATAAALARSIARAVCGGCGGGGGRWRWRAVTSPVTRVTRAARHARVRIRHHRASRTSSPFSVPPAHDRHAARAAAAAAALTRSRARRRRRWGWGWRSVTPRVTRGTRVTCVTRAREHVITAHRARHHRSSFPHAPTRVRCDGGGARSLDSARGVWPVAVEVAGGGGGGRLHRPSRALRAPRITRVCAYVITAHRARHHRFPSPPRTTGTPRALLRRRRSLARSRARRRRRWGWGWRSVTPRVTRVTRARVNVITARRARHHRFSFPPCTTGTRALQRRRRSLAPSIARARCGGGDGGCGRSRRT